MEEWSNMIWLGGAIAEHGPIGFQLLLSYMHKFLRHYIDGLDATASNDFRAGHNALQAYAEAVEQMAVNEQLTLIARPMLCMRVVTGQPHCSSP